MLAQVLLVVGPQRNEDQYHFPLAKPPKATSPIKAMINPHQKLQTKIRTTPRITRIPPRPMPPVRESATTCPFHTAED
jgi:hypothetical protein